MPGHLLIALSTVAIAAVVDLQQRRIPNRLLLSACLLHIVFVLVSGVSLNPGRIQCTFLVLVLLLLSHPRLGMLILSQIGMGDIKLITYLVFTLVPEVGPSIWMNSIAISAAMLLIAIAIRRQLSSSLPLAPLLGIASVISAIVALN